jgi:hypothetical protein
MFKVLNKKNLSSKNHVSLHNYLSNEGEIHSKIKKIKTSLMEDIPYKEVLRGGCKPVTTDGNLNPPPKDHYR